MSDTDLEEQKNELLALKEINGEEITKVYIKDSEKIEDLETRRSEQHERMNRLSVKIDNIDNHVTTLVEKVAIMQKFAWVLIGIVATVVGATLTQFIT